jgi:hypothetical protein
MAFKVRFAQNTTRHHETGDTYDFRDGGVLVITYADEAKWTEYHPPGTWQQVTASQDHLPGYSGGDSEGGFVIHHD